MRRQCKPDMRRMPATIPIAAIESAVKALGGYYPAGEVRRLHAALNFLDHKHFVILSGLSGTGKTQLAIKYALAVHGITAARRGGPVPVCVSGAAGMDRSDGTDGLL